MKLAAGIADREASRIAYRIRGEMTLNFLFEHARREATEPPAAAPSESESAET